MRKFSFIVYKWLDTDTCNQWSHVVFGLDSVTFQFSFWVHWASLVAQSVKNLPAVQKTKVWSLGQEDPLEKEMTTHSSVLAWRILWTEEPGGLQSMGSQRVRHNWLHTHLHLHLVCSGDFHRLRGKSIKRQGFKSYTLEPINHIVIYNLA